MATKHIYCLTSISMEYLVGYMIIYTREHTEIYFALFGYLDTYIYSIYCPYMVCTFYIYPIYKGDLFADDVVESLILSLSSPRSESVYTTALLYHSNRIPNICTSTSTMEKSKTNKPNN